MPYADPVRKRQADRERVKSPEKIREARRRYCLAHPEKVRDTKRRYRLSHPEEGRAACKKWYAANLEKARDVTRIKNARRRAHKLQNGSSPYAFREIFALADYKCAYCLERPSKLQIDHLVPLSRGGPDAEINIIPACRTCNVRKLNHIVEPKFFMSDAQKAFFEERTGR